MPAGNGLRQPAERLLSHPGRRPGASDRPHPRRATGPPAAPCCTFSDVANSQDDISTHEPHPDLLAAVVLHVLVTEGRDGISTDEVARACERDPHKEAERHEIETALEILVRDELAVRRDGPREDAGTSPTFAPTRAAVRAAELSF